MLKKSLSKITVNRNGPLRLTILLGSFFCPPAFSQTDSLHLEEITVTSYFSERPLLRLPASVSVIDSAQLNMQHGLSLVPALNTAPGVRMEERSPGSYRLSIRGSLLRSPFGIRNVKVYLDEFPLTDAGGNTYLNVLDPSALTRMEILKGPDGSIFGANSGGVLRIGPEKAMSDSFRLSAGASAGSYGLFREQVRWRQRAGKHEFALHEAFQYAEGYRENSMLRRTFLQGNERWRYAPIAELRLLVLYSDLAYRTPGGLTSTQAHADPSAARPPSPTLPGAEEQHAGVLNQTFFAGALNEVELSKRIRHVFAVFGSHTDFKNPFITNYETRKESSGGMRTWLEAFSPADRDFAWRVRAGTEMQQTRAHITNYDNLGGQPGALQAADRLDAAYSFAFLSATLDIRRRWMIEAAASLNANRLFFTHQHPDAEPENKKLYSPQWMPRVAASYQLLPALAWRLSWSRGYSPPTLAEVRSSDNLINTQLEPETGWNYESGFRLRSKNGRLWWDVSAFYYQLEDAIVRRMNDAGQEYFVNAGGTQQEGLESQLILQVIEARGSGWLRGLELRQAATVSRFTFRDYYDGAENYSGNKLTGVPAHVFVSSLRFDLPQRVYLFAQHNFTDVIPLNDANTAYAPSYHLVQLKSGWKKQLRRADLEISAGIDNLLSADYSLGNDLNAFGGRYFNPAPPRNFFVSLAMLLD